MSALMFSHFERFFEEEGATAPLWCIEHRGSRSGEIFDDGPHSTVRQLVIFHSSSTINAIWIEYDRKGRSVWFTHGDHYSGSNAVTIKLDYPEEFFTSVHGHYGNLLYAGTSLRSLTFKSNKRSYGPYGNEEGSSFSIQVPGTKIVGFHGLFSDRIRAIGTWIRPSSENEKQHLSKPLDPAPSSYVQAGLPAGNPSPTIKLIAKEDAKVSKQISNDQVNGTKGDHNGNFPVGCTYNYQYNYYK